MSQSYPTIPSPSGPAVTQTFGEGGSSTAAPVDQELLYSTAGFTQKGVTLAAGQGVLTTGTVLARKDSDKLYYRYATAGSGGLDVAVGVLRRAVDTGTDSAGATKQGNIVIQGILKKSLVSGADSGAITDLNARVDATRDLFIF